MRPLSRKVLSFSFLLCALAWLSAPAVAQPKPASQPASTQHPLTRLLLNNTLDAVLIHNLYDGVLRLRHYAHEIGEGKDWDKEFKRSAKQFQKRLKLPKAPKTVKDFFTMAGLRLNTSLGINLHFLHGRNDVGFIMIAQVQDPKRLHHFLIHTLARRTHNDLLSSCYRAHRKYKSSLKTLYRRGVKGPYDTAKILKTYPHIVLSADCPAPGTCKLEKGVVSCQHKGIPYHSYSERKTLAKQQVASPWSKQKIHGGWLIGGKKAFNYALLENRYAVVSNSRTLLRRALDVYKRGGLAAMKQFSFSKTSSIVENVIFHQAITRAILRQIQISNRGKTKKRKGNKPADWLLRTQRSLLHTLATLSYAPAQYKLNLRTQSNSNKGRFFTFLQTPPKQHMDALQLVPANATAVLSHNLSKPLLRTARRILRQQAPPVALILGSLIQEIGQEMTLALLPGPPKSIRLMLLLNIRDPKTFKSKLRDLEGMIPKMMFQIVRNVTYRGYKVRFFRREAFRSSDEVAYTTHKNTLILLFERAAPRHLLFKEVLRVAQQKQKSILEDPHFLQSLKRARKHNIFFHLSFPKVVRSLLSFSRNQRNHRDQPFFTFLQKLLSLEFSWTNHSPKGSYRFLLHFNKGVHTRWTQSSSR